MRWSLRRKTAIYSRICSPPEAFLLVLYSPVHSKPEFYEIVTVSGKSTMDFDLLTGYEVVSISKVSLHFMMLNVVNSLFHAKIISRSKEYKIVILILKLPENGNDLFADLILKGSV